MLFRSPLTGQFLERCFVFFVFFFFADPLQSEAEREGSSARAAERRVGKEGDSTCRSRGSPCH